MCFILLFFNSIHQLNSNFIHFINRFVISFYYFVLKCVLVVGIILQAGILRPFFVVLVLFSSLEVEYLDHLEIVGGSLSALKCGFRVLFSGFKGVLHNSFRLYPHHALLPVLPILHFADLLFHFAILVLLLLNLWLLLFNFQRGLILYLFLSLTTTSSQAAKVVLQLAPLAKV